MRKRAQQTVTMSPVAFFDSACAVDNAVGALAYWEKKPQLTIMWRADTCYYLVAPTHIAHGCVAGWEQTSPEAIETFLNS